MDNQIGRPFGATGMRTVGRSGAFEIYKGDGTSPLRVNARRILSPLKIRVVPRKRESGQDFAPPMQELKKVNDEINGTTVIPQIKIKS